MAAAFDTAPPFTADGEEAGEQARPPIESYASAAYRSQSQVGEGVYCYYNGCGWHKSPRRTLCLSWCEYVAGTQPLAITERPPCLVDMRQPRRSKSHQQHRSSSQSRSTWRCSRWRSGRSCSSRPSPCSPSSARQATLLVPSKGALEDHSSTAAVSEESCFVSKNGQRA